MSNVSDEQIRNYLREHLRVEVRLDGSTGFADESGNSHFTYLWTMTTLFLDDEEICSDVAEVSA